ncbi:MAG: pyridoxal phosphate-dependent aminotransferase [Vicinamibacterales bacterium]|jgi:aspartate aminotransferase|nr:pyridoxal phosphate-dependent aminotransferase [Vicinamibacterales bacterium]MDP7478945.1 pyridoxal phosphate-dependent aminotransferase [Vicinamibacterales bacterium]HJN44676.1 pyridoxal phosphate-dependent aminotransferase [Vicinamibacterales bacterium]
MANPLDAVPLSGIFKIRDLMYDVERPFRLDHGDISFETPAPVREAMKQALDAGHTHYVQTGGLPRLRELLAEKLRSRNAIPVGDPDEVLVTAGGMHGLYLTCRAALDRGDEVLVPDPAWGPTLGHILAVGATPVPCPLRPALRWGYDPEALRASVTPRTRAILVNTPHNPTGGVLSRSDLEAIARLARERDLLVISDEPYEDIVYDDAPHVSLAALPEMYERTVSVYTFSKSHVMTGLRLGYVALKNEALRARVLKLISLTASNVSSVIQYGGIGALEADQHWVADNRTELQTRRDRFYAGVADLKPTLTGSPPAGGFFAFLRIDSDWEPAGGLATGQSQSWAMAEHLIAHARVGTIPGVDFGAVGEGYIRCCFAREPDELDGALAAMCEALAG